MELIIVRIYNSLTNGSSYNKCDSPLLIQNHHLMDYSDIETRGQQYDTATKTKTRATNNQQNKLNDKIYPMENEVGIIPNKGYSQTVTQKSSKDYS